MALTLRKTIAVWILLLLGSGSLLVQAQPGKSNAILRTGADLPEIKTDKKLSVSLYINPVGLPADSLSLSYAFYSYNPKGDSLLLCRKVCPAFELQHRVAVYQMAFPAKGIDTAWYLPVFYQVMQKTGAVPPGSYKAFVLLRRGDSLLSRNAIIYGVDSTLSLSSPVRKELSTALVPEQKTGLVAKLFSSEVETINSTTATAAKAIERSRHQLDRLMKARGLSPKIQKVGDKEYINLYYDDWFIGRYQTEAGKSISTQVASQQAQLAGGITATANTELEGYRSLLSQVNDLTRQKQEDKELRGQIGVSGSWANGQPEYSTQDNNYYELRANLETEVMDIPVGIEGYYTTQDAHRTIKSSYVRVHYDAEKAKSELLKLMGGFKQQYSNTVAKGKGLEQVYGSYLANLKDNKGALLNNLKKETGLGATDGSLGSINSEALKAKIRAGLEAKLAAAAKDTAVLLSTAASKLDSAGRAKALAARATADVARAKQLEDSVEHLYQKAMQRYEQIQALEKKVAKYEGLLEQYKNTAYFDSALAYSKMGDLNNADAATYKQLAKRASGLLPEGKAKTFIAGLTSLDAGIFPKYVSKYTMAGQQLKGLDAGYDIGFAQVGLTVGKTEYAGRDGSLDKYTTYGARALFTPLKDQKVGLIYYGYTPSRAAISSDKDFYKNIDIALPTFRSPVHIVSATYEGTIAKNIHLDGEAATSYRNGDLHHKFSDGFDADRLAWHLNGEGNIPKTTLALTGSYEHGGKDFQNSTLPVIITGTDLYKGGIKGELFRGFLTAGVEYNHMQQANFYSVGGNNRWGFDIATHSKQYPSLALSYKPFATFRSALDTLAVPQRPLTGAVWTGKANYQIKKSGGRVWRLTAVYNKSTSRTDSVSYASDLIQLNIIYTTKKWMGMLSGGQSDLQSSGLPTDSLNPAHVATTFGAGSASYSFSKGLNVSGGMDIGFAHYGLSKWGLNGGMSYRMVKVPLSIRLYGRYSAYRLPGYSGQVYSDASTNSSSSGNNNNLQPLEWRNLVSGGIDLSWQLKMKLNK